jgi:hypothetical protein
MGIEQKLFEFFLAGAFTMMGYTFIIIVLFSCIGGLLYLVHIWKNGGK